MISEKRMKQLLKPMDSDEIVRRETKKVIDAYAYLKKHPLKETPKTEMQKAHLPASWCLSNGKVVPTGLGKKVMEYIETHGKVSKEELLTSVTCSKGTLDITLKYLDAAKDRKSVV